MKNKIICGFAGIGKSYLAKRQAGIVDLESTPFNKDFDLYTDVAMHMLKNGYTPLISCHEEVRNMLKKKGAEYVVVIPSIAYKKMYIERYKKRGNNKDFINLFSHNWEKFILDITNNEKKVVVLMEDYFTI